MYSVRIVRKNPANTLKLSTDIETLELALSQAANDLVTHAEFGAYRAFIIGENHRYILDLSF